METLLVNNKRLIDDLDKQAMAYMPALELDGEINMMSNVYCSTVMSILHFGEGELNFRKGERCDTLNVFPDLVNYCNAELTAWNARGIDSITIAIQTITDFINTASLDDTSVSASEFADMRLRIAEVLIESPLKAADVEQLMDAFDEVVAQAADTGELGVVTFMKDKLIALKDVRLTTTRGTEENSIPVWKIIAAIIIFGFPVYKALRCILSGKCCNTVSKLEGAIVFIAALAWKLC